ncbi:MAG: TonB family protein [Burkholderiales bacterium]|nr:TonB family protein [Burkholderiales bacterium]
MAAAHGTLFEREPALRPAARHTVVLSVLGVHAMAAWALLQVDSFRRAVVEAAPLFVTLVTSPAPSHQVPPATEPRPKATVPPRRGPVAAPAAPAAPTPMPAAISVPATTTEPAAPPPQLVQPVVAASPAPAASPTLQVPSAPTGPRAVPITAVRYVVEPEPVYPATSRRLGESGEVRLRVEIDTDGRARRISVHHSSGFPRLDESAVAAVRAARFTPFIENGVALVVWTIVPIAFELQG